MFADNSSTATKVADATTNVINGAPIERLRDFNRAVDECEDRCLKEMQQRLRELGIVEGIWRGPTEKEVVMNDQRN